MTVHGTGRSFVFAAFALVLVAALAGCSSIDKALSGMQKPGASIQGVNIADLSAESLGLVFDVKIDNPYDVNLPLANVDYALAARSTQFLSGQAGLSGSVPAKGSRVVQIPASVNFNDLLNAVSGVKLGQVVPYKADLGLSVDAPGVGPLRLPVSHSGDIPVPNVPNVELADIRWGNVSLESAEATIKLRLTNTNEFPVNLKGLAYALQLDGKDVFSGKTAQPLALKGGESGDIEIPVSASAARAGLALVNMIRKSSASYTMTGGTDFTTPFGPISLPFQRSGSSSMSR